MKSFGQVECNDNCDWIKYLTITGGGGIKLTGTPRWACQDGVSDNMKTFDMSRDDAQVWNK